MRKRNGLMITLLLCAVLLSGCGEILDIPIGIPKDTATKISEGKQPEMSWGEAKEQASAAGNAGKYEITEYDRDTSGSQGIEINLSHPEEGGGEYCAYNNNQLIISGPGTYVLSGKMTKGKITVSVFEDEVVHLILNDVEIRADSGAAIYIENAGKVIITAKEGTKNSLCDGPDYGKRQRACVFSNSDLTINGGGFLQVYGFHGDGVRSKDQVKIISTSLYAKAKEDGIRGNDGVILLESGVEVECEGTGIFADSERDMVILRGGSCRIVAGKNAIAASQYVSIFDIQTDLYSVLDIVKCDGIQEWREEF